VVGGRTIHPLSSCVGGFFRLPDVNELKKLAEAQKDVLEAAIKLGKLFAQLNYPKFKRETEYVALQNSKEYAIYDGYITSNKGLKVLPDDFEREVEEIHKPFEVVKRVRRLGRTIFPGAIARINLNHKKLNKEARKLLKDSKVEVPNYNSFYNVFAQVIEIVHCVEEAGIILRRILNKEFGRARKDFKLKAGKGAASIEAPRGTLYHYYKLNSRGIVTEANIITPTAQFISNLEEDIKAYFPKTKRLSKETKRRRLQMLIRAYDPCITCTVH
jgi:coenzyme F420-reducing hydrogenase alpha subunit